MQEPIYLQDFSLTTTTSSECIQVKNVEDNWRKIYYEINDSLIINLKKWFSPEALNNIAVAVDNFFKNKLL